MQNTTILYDFAKKYHRTGITGNGYIEYPTLRARQLAPEIEQWGVIHGFNIKASQVNNSVVVEVKESPFEVIIERLDELKKELNG